MRDRMVVRRRLLALVGGLLMGGAACLPAAARHARRHRDVARRRRRVIVLDPGHGGLDPGAISPHGVMEKNITLATARELARELARSGRYSPILTRHGDRFVPLALGRIAG